MSQNILPEPSIESIMLKAMWTSIKQTAKTKVRKIFTQKNKQE